MKKHFCLCMTILLAAAKIGFSQTYSYQLDSSFSGNGVKDFTYFNNIDRLFGCDLQSNDKLVTAGFSKNTATSKFELAVTRFLTNGDPDTTFGTANGTVYIPLGNLVAIGGQTPKVKIAPDGKIVAALSNMGTSTSNDIFVCRLDSTGVLDPSFNGTGTLSVDMTGSTSLPDMANAIDFDASGNVWLAGVTRNGGTPLDNDFAVIKVKSNGTLDASFDTDGKKLFNLTGTAEFAKSIKVDNTGKIVVAGTAGTNQLVIRFDSTGVLDPTFNSTGYLTFSFGSSSGLSDMGLDPNNNIVVTGYSGTSTSSLCVGRITSSGIFDPTFGTAGKSTITLGTFSCTPTSMHIQNDSRIIVGGYLETTAQGTNFFAARVNDAGALDLTFNGNGFVNSPIIAGNVDESGNGMAVMSDGRIMMTGTIVYSSAVNEDCGMLRWKPVLQTTGINEMNPANTFSVSPNPFSHQLQVFSLQEGEATITDINGRTIIRAFIQAGENILSTPSLAKGMYLIRINGNAGIKLIRE